MLKNYGLYLAWTCAALGVLGSLYFSEVKGLEPCHLCWYQRIFLFPLTLILGIGTYQGDSKVVRYTLLLAFFGFLFAIYQVAIQEIPGWNPIELCGAGPSCTEKTNIGLGFITMPMLSALNFFLIILLLIGVWSQNEHEELDLD